MKKITCSKCPNPHGKNHAYCNPCHAADMRKFRKTHRLTPEQAKKDNARSYAGVYLRRGKIKRQPCQVRGCAKKSQMHHHDYDKPLEVEWYCRDHHMTLKHYSSNGSANSSSFEI